uniref:Calmodulin n=1 Tax=Globisporangium ultimum (strain ATCC 200006 / CBS 805.95 / DAOM BR144) TaxID=431595 RepID=K3WVY8_GLOUD
MIPSQIGELDMSRIHDAENVIMQEEARFGRFTRDTHGLVVPEEEVQHRLNMMEVSGGAYAAQMKSHDPHESQHEHAAFLTGEQDPSSNSEPSAHPASLAGKLYAKKKAGMLGPISKPVRKPVLHCLRQRSRGAQLEETLASEKQANIKFGMLIDALREEIERKEMDVAYFESIAGVQFYGDELHEFATKARKEIAQLRRELHEKEYIYEHKVTNIHKKEELIHVFKEKQKAAIEMTRAAEIDKNKEQFGENSVRAGGSRGVEDKPERDTVAVKIDQHGMLTGAPSNQEDVTRARALAEPTVLHLCATLIQKIARGMVTRAAFENMKIEYYVSSKYIQAAVRGFLVRRRVAKMYWQNAASVILQRYTRGMLARRLVQVRRHNLCVLLSTITLQKVVRGHFGRIRMKKVRRVFSARMDIVDASGELRIPDLKELADACFRMVSIPSMTFVRKFGAVENSKPLTPLVLGLVRILMLFTSDKDADVDFPNARWKEAANFLRCSVRLCRRMKKIAAAAEGRYLRTSQLGNTLLDAYMADQQFQEETFRRLESGWKAATSIFRWITSFSTVTRLQSVLPAYNLGFDGPFLLASATDSREAAQDQVEATETAIHDEAIERRFVPADLVRVAGYPHHRPRPVVLVFAHDVPLASKDAIVEKVMTALPGLFIVMNRSPTENHQQGYRSPTSHKNTPSMMTGKATSKRQPDWEGLHIAEIRAAVSVGYNVILESDIGLSDPPQRKFLGAFSALKAAIQPSPLCILVKGSLRNRAVGTYLQNEPKQEINDDSDKITAHREKRSMTDAKIKHVFEQVAEHLYNLSQPTLTTQMMQLSAAVGTPAVAFILVMEAIIILLTPTKRYDGPKPSTSAVSWKLGKRLLANPSFFAKKLQDVKQQEVARENLLALDRYLQHSDWPTKARAHSMSTGAALLFALSSWVEAIVHCAHLIMDSQGLAPEISRTTPICGLFGNVITYYDNVASDGKTGEETSVLQLMDAILADVQVHRKCHKLDGRRYIINVYHDCLRIYFTAYDPTSSWRWQAIISESDVNMLLAPNSIERGNVKCPPKTQTEMYDRLVQLCLLQASKSSQQQRFKSDSTMLSANAFQSPGATSTPTEALVSKKHLVVHPRAIRLYRRAITLSGYLTTITISELSRGRIQVDAFIHNSSHGKDLRAIFNLEGILSRLSAQQARCVFVTPEQLPRLVLDRLHLFRISQSLLSREKQHVPPNNQTSIALTQEKKRMLPRTDLLDRSMNMKLTIRTRETSPGRLLMRKAVRSPWLTAVWICSVYEQHSTRDFRVEFYQPQTSEKFKISLSQQDCEEFVIQSKHSTRHALQAMMKHFQFQLDSETGSVRSCKTRRVLARFPWSIPFAAKPHQMVSKRQVVRAYIQVERCEPTQDSNDDAIQVLHGARANGQLHYRVCLPDTCGEQSLILKDSEIESCFKDGRSWITALSLADRKRMSREFLLNLEHPVGVKSKFEGASSRKFHLGESNRIHPLGSLQLLDAVSVSPDSIKRCYKYESEEIIHKGSYRANGELVIVQVGMRAVVVDMLVPQIPVDRITQEDSFVMTFHFYHPRSSAAAVVQINGRIDLREIVGPDKATLIQAATVHELIQHIVETRTQVLLKPDTKTIHSCAFRGAEVPFATTSTVTGVDTTLAFLMEIVFQRDRLYAKQKATPINEHLLVDHATNTNKLIDRALERGLKVLTKTRTISGHSRVILTVFDVGFTKWSQHQGHDHNSLLFRVDAYVHETSSRLSLLVDGADLVHVVGDRTDLLEQEVNVTDEDDDNGDGQTDHKHEKCRQLAALLAEHIGIESRQDGASSDRLFITECFVPASTEDPPQKQTKFAKINLLFKTTRLVGHDQILVSMTIAQSWFGAMNPEQASDTICTFVERS